MLATVIPTQDKCILAALTFTTLAVSACAAAAPNA